MLVALIPDGGRRSAPRQLIDRTVLYALGALAPGWLPRDRARPCMKTTRRTLVVSAGGWIAEQPRAVRQATSIPARRCGIRITDHTSTTRGLGPHHTAAVPPYHHANRRTSHLPTRSGTLTCQCHACTYYTHSSSGLPRLVPKIFPKKYYSIHHIESYDTCTEH